MIYIDWRALRGISISLRLVHLVTPASSEMTRWVMVDDTDPGIKYTGDWFADKGSLDSSGNWGPPYLSTVHGTKTQGSFSYTFSGPAFTLTGAIQVPRSASGGTSWECVVDGTSITVDNPMGIENRIEFCAQGGLTDGPHTLEVNAKGSSSQTFWFDHLQYQPSTSVSLADAAVDVDTSDAMWGFGTGWSPIFPGYLTNQTGAKVNFEFNGISFKWYGFYDASYPFAVSTASYSIDGAAPINFNLNGISAQQTTVQYSQVFFTTDTLSPGTHKVEVVYNGNTNTTPLTVQVIVIQNGTSSSGTSVGGGAAPGPTSGAGTLTTGSPTSGVTSTGSTSTATSPGGTISSTSGNSATSTGTTPNTDTGSSSSNGQTSTASKSNTGAIVGGAVGGIAILLLLALLLFWMYRRKKYRNIAEVPGNTIPEPYLDHPSSQRGMYSPASATTRGRSHGSAPYDSHSYTESSSHPPTTPVPFQTPPTSSRVPISLNAEKRVEALQSAAASHIQAPQVVHDVDSGIRLMDIHGTNPELVHVLPPVYTQT